MNPHLTFVSLTQLWAHRAPMAALAPKAVHDQMAAAVYAVVVVTMCYRRCGPSVVIAASIGAAMCSVRNALPHSG